MKVNYLPDHPSGETPESLDEVGINVITEFGKRGSEKDIAKKMDKTYSPRRHEMVNEKPLVSILKGRWPSLFRESQVIACTVYTLYMYM